ncbi:MAG: hypothetical protein O2968_16525 [Acidobacteria bacterium]|nr:hypothetical protein [Acidobacteriota bacterium]
MANSTFSDWLRFGVVTLQFAILSLLAVVFRVEGRGFRWLLAAAGVGFVIHHLLPLRLRMPFFALLSVSSMVVAFGPPLSGENALWLVAIGLPLIGLAHVPIRFRFRIALIAAAGCLLAAMRVDELAAPWSGAIWPAFGAMFMFRMVVYLYDLRTNAAPISLVHGVAYFFMLPSACFPLFPVVDYKTFCRSHYNDDACEIYQKGLTWIFRGIFQLLVYRYLYRNGPLNPADVTDAASVALYMLTVYLLYLKVSGTFHVVIGLLHMFGFNLPETHHRYLLSSSFTDFWRRINIYWKDFIQKLFFYPVFFRTKRWGETAALALATTAAFVATWLLHAYQTFWILGRFPLIWTDVIFWAILASLVVVNVLYESRKKKHRRLSTTRRTWKSELRRAASTMATFATIVVLWALWTAETMEQWLSQMAAYGNMTAEGALLIAGVLLSVGVSAVLFGHSSSERPTIAKPSLSGSPRSFWRTALQTGLAATVLLVVGVYPRLLRFAPELARASAQVRSDRLSTRDGAMLVRGYYEDLTSGVRFNPELWGMYAQKPADWKEIADSDAVAYNDDFRHFELIPNKTTIFKGVPIQTNRWGMRDRDYEKSKPPGVYRMVMVGASRAMGSGVVNGEPFEAVLEDRLNAELSPLMGLRYEVLNFAVGSYGALRKMRILEQKAYEFEPDALLYVTHVFESSFSVFDLTRAVLARLDIPYPYLRQVVEEAGVSPEMPEQTVRRRLERYGKEMTHWSWGQVQEQCRERGIRTYMILIPGLLTEPVTRGFRQDVAAKSADYGFTSVDVADTFEDVPSHESLAIAPWDGHPNAKGHRMLADKLFGELRPYLISDHDKATTEDAGSNRN